MAGATTIPWDPNEVTGPEISTPELHGEGMVAPGQEELAREFEEGPQATDEEKILGKFNSTEDLAKAYAELEKKLGGQDASPAAESPSSPSSYTRDQAVETYGEEAVTALAEKGLDMADIMFKADNGEDISDHYDALAETFQVPRQVVENYVAKSQTQEVASEGSELTEADAAELKSMVGGDEQFTKLSQWAASNLDAADLADYNAVVDSGNKDAIRWALKSLMSMQSTPRRQEPRLLGGRPPSAEAVFNSKQEVLNAMNKKDERGRRLYDTDPAYRAKVAEALERSNVF